MLPLLLLTLFQILLSMNIAFFPISHSLQHIPNQCNEKCGHLNIPFPFHLNSSCATLSPSAFQLSCSHSSTLLLNTTSQTYQVLKFYSDGVLIGPFPFPCRQYNDLNSFTFQGSNNFGVSDENILGLFDCEDSSLCKAECQAIAAWQPDCDGKARASRPSCCYPLSDHSVWRLGDEFSVFAKFGCRGFASWAVAGRGVKVEWAVPKNNDTAERELCGGNGHVVNATAVKGGVRCLCEEGFVGDGFAKGKGCVKSCMKDGKEVYGDKCNNKKKHNDKKLLIIGGVLSSCLIVASFGALFCLQNRPAGKPRDFDTSRDNFHCEISLRRASKTRLFAYRELEAATKGFEDARKLAEGLNGAMYAGILFDGSRVAVQKINCENESDMFQVLSEVEVLASLSHPNLACLIGCCVDLPYTPLVVYEYPPNGTLEEHLRHHREAKLSLDWAKRLNIAAETASILAFLHYEASPPIFHHDLKPGSIFLDGDLSVKLAGFELPTPKPQDYNFCNGARFRKNDVCDMGLLLLELISGPNENKPLDLPSLALQKIRNGRLEEIVDPLLSSYHDQQSIESVADLAMRCLLCGGDGKIGIVDVARELGQIGKDQYGVDVGTSSSGSSNKRGPQETFSNSSLLQMISMSPDSIYLP